MYIGGLMVFKSSEMILCPVSALASSTEILRFFTHIYLYIIYRHYIFYWKQCLVSHGLLKTTSDILFLPRSVFLRLSCLCPCATISLSHTHICFLLFSSLSWPGNSGATLRPLDLKLYSLEPFYEKRLHHQINLGNAESNRFLFCGSSWASLLCWHAPRVPENCGIQQSQNL